MKKQESDLRQWVGATVSELVQQLVAPERPRQRWALVLVLAGLQLMLQLGEVFVRHEAGRGTICRNISAWHGSPGHKRVP